MNEVPPICAVCAKRPTVRSHILPRALFHDSKRPGRTVVIGGLEDGYRVSQSGKLDHSILCEDHERQLGPADEYGIAFCRAWRRLAKGDNGPVLVPNPRPTLLVDFALTCIWRMAASKTGGRPVRALGPYTDLVEGRIFGPGESCDPAVVIESLEMDDGKGAPLIIGVLPCPAQADGSSWHFIVSGLRFVVDFSGVSGKQSKRVNSLTFVPIARTAPRSLDEIDGLRFSLERMNRRRRWQPLSQPDS